MREIRQSGSEGGEPQYNAASLPLSLWTAHGMCLPTTLTFLGCVCDGYLSQIV